MQKQERGDAALRITHLTSALRSRPRRDEKRTEPTSGAARSLVRTPKSGFRAARHGRRLRRAAEEAAPRGGASGGRGRQWPSPLAALRSSSAWTRVYQGRSPAMRECVWVWAWALAAAALLALAAALPKRTDQDFEFDDDGLQQAEEGAAGGRRPRRYVYDPHNPLCRSLVCKKREVCVLKDAFTALCASKKEILRKGDVLVAASTSMWDAPWGRDDDEDVFYEGGDVEGPKAGAGAEAGERCVGCGARGRGEFLCGSDNRTYSSLCRLDLHNCVRRPLRPVRLACRGFCPCRERVPRRSRSRRPALAPDPWKRTKYDSSHNEVLPQRASRRRLFQGYEGCALDKMANRLLDWFSVLMEEAGAVAPPEDGFPEECKPEVRWMFAHLDTDGDGVLSAANLYSLRHDERERCLRPFLASCRVEGGGGGGAGGGRGVDRAGWCGCLRRAARPCTALARAHPDAKSAGAYVPSCDSRGFYRPRQCHAALGVCWCVDAHGVERPHSRTKGAPACPPHPTPLAPAPDAPTPDADADAPADDEDAAPGSGDAELRF
ncbi:hypothetical protein K1T71_005349 [Dendrolimus kikuchii]|uniref:Uncharacterized protein n=1 Tax=Dendrolimus kikuchii TaxID=765133 RepID=A0ACC1D3R3_9NEOP|nr:hypothetical protein K1T71_005349 [Dendrolimus kikuchii]